MAYRDEDEIRALVREHVSDALDDTKFRKDLSQTLYREVWQKVEKEMTEEVRLIRQAIWAVCLALFLMFVFFGAEYYIQMSSPEGRCEDACGMDGVHTVLSAQCVCNPPD